MRSTRLVESAASAACAAPYRCRDARTADEHVGTTYGASRLSTHRGPAPTATSSAVEDAGDRGHEAPSIRLTFLSTWSARPSVDDPRHGLFVSGWRRCASAAGRRPSLAVVVLSACLSQYTPKSYRNSLLRQGIVCLQDSASDQQNSQSPEQGKNSWGGAHIALISYGSPVGALRPEVHLRDPLARRSRTSSGCRLRTACSVI